MSKSRAARIAVPLVVLILVVVILAGWFIKTRNTIITMDESVNSAWSEVENQLQRRSDLIPNLVETVKGFAGQEQEVFGAIADARARLAGAGTVEETAESYTELNSALSRLLVVVENYPDLKSNQNFIRLQDELAGTENRIAVARKRYNDSVRAFNTRIRVFPGSIVANSAGFDEREYFEVSEEAMTVPKVEF